MKNIKPIIIIMILLFAVLDNWFLKNHNTLDKSDAVLTFWLLFAGSFISLLYAVGIVSGAIDFLFKRKK